ncbi:type II secretion system protein N [Salinisphaera sp. SWV1]|uniref:type II secretion system protein N n=1 Tax=Salinisphaera sp. SWV1 TaxID=3454139 RepID=UPI003F825610
MNWRIMRFAAVGGVAFMIGLVTYLPASLVAGWVTGNTPVRLQGVSGTLLDGRAAYAVLPHGAVSHVRWHVHPAALLLGELSATLRVDSDLGHVSGDLHRGVLGSNSLDDVQGEATIGWLSDLAGYTFVPLSGRIGLHLDHLRFDDNLAISALAGTVQLTDSRWELLNPPLPLGRFKARLDRDGNGVEARIVDSKGPLALTGRVALSGRNRRYDLNVKLRARAGADDRLKQMLRPLGTPDSQGWYRIHERGAL